MSEDRGFEEFKATKPFLNIELGKSIHKDLVSSIAGNSVGVNKEKLDSDIRSAEDIIATIVKKISSESGEFGKELRHNDVLPQLNNITGEERSLAAEYMVEQLLLRSGDKGKGPAYLRAHELYQNHWNLAEEKANKAPHTNRGGTTRVGTTYQRRQTIETVVDGIIKGPSDDEPYFWGYEDRQDSRVIHRAKPGETVTYLGSIIEPSKFPDPKIKVSNILFRNPDLGNKAVEIKQKLSTQLDLEN